MAALKKIPPGVILTESRLVPIRSEADPYIAVAQARQMAQEMGFDTYATTEIETAVSELTTNVLRHGIEGVAWLRRLGNRFEITCLDRGPGFGATAGRPPAGLGVGLAGVERLMDGLEIEDRPEGGARVSAWRDLPREGEEGHQGSQGSDLEPLSYPAPIYVAVAMRAAEGESVCGDAYALIPTGNGIVLAVVDGVGHGPGAAEAANVALGAMEQRATVSPFASLPELLEAAHQASHRGRGAVAGLARITPDGISWAGVGNVHLFWTLERVQSLLTGDSPSVSQQRSHFRVGTPGCLGVSWRDSPSTEAFISAENFIMLATDGLPSQAVQAALGRGAVGHALVSDRLRTALRDLTESLLTCTCRDGRDDTLVLAVQVP